MSSSGVGVGTAPADHCVLAFDFHYNKRIISEVAVVPSKRLRNKTSGFTTHLMKCISAAPSAASTSSSRRRSASARTTTSPRSLPTKALLESLNFDSIQVNVITPVLAVPGAGWS
ncbi:hypothetical protein BJ912DRAFT_1065162 [Pholiota molesta]|nr:hypothetical protein BJ912DRAFT_1065162 [Pholiota molesta]